MEDGPEAEINMKSLRAIPNLPTWKAPGGDGIHRFCF